MSRNVHCGFIPPHILDQLAKATAVVTPESHAAAQPSAMQRTAVVSKQLRDQRRRNVMDLAALAGPRAGRSDRQIYDCRGSWVVDAELVRGEGAPAIKLQSANLAYDNLGAALTFFTDVLDRQSIDQQGTPIKVDVNFGERFCNALWDGSRVVLGTGDDKVFTDFSHSLDVLGHELTHAVVQYTANLDYFGQPGALHESFADAFGLLIEQRLKGKDIGTAGNWLIGDEVMGEELFGEAVRSMAHPGTAYDNPILGKDPQPAHMKDYYGGQEDFQGVHINSGIPNRAFYLTAMEIGMLDAAKIWYAGLQVLGTSPTFADAATVLGVQARILARDKQVPATSPQAVRSAFREVGVS